MSELQEESTVEQTDGDVRAYERDVDSRMALRSVRADGEGGDSGVLETVLATISRQNEILEKQSRTICDLEERVHVLEDRHGYTGRT